MTIAWIKSQLMTKLAVVSVIMAAAGIVVQILGGEKYPAVPPGALLAVAAGLLAVRHKWTPLAVQGLRKGQPA